MAISRIMTLAIVAITIAAASTALAGSNILVPANAIPDPCQQFQNCQYYVLNPDKGCPACGTKLADALNFVVNPAENVAGTTSASSISGNIVGQIALNPQPLPPGDSSLSSNQNLIG